ncbi:MAG TPA: hypothetical protein VFM19_11095 [Candidatus Limnocylindria bacterium]|nr:hypothetical protein [Candidatus Limnocylindria bacterium]
MGPVLDAAVVVLALLVCGSLGLLAWTLAVGGRAAVRTERERVAAARAELAMTERALRERSAAVETALRGANERIRPKGDR